MKQQLILVRGVPGEGKTTFARKLVEVTQGNAGNAGKFKLYENDAWRGSGDERIYDKRFNYTAKAWCLVNTAASLKCGDNVIVSNTFARIEELEPYFLLVEELRMRGIEIEVTVLHVEGIKYGNSVHDSDTDTVNYNRYREQWQDYNGEYALGNTRPEEERTEAS